MRQGYESSLLEVESPGGEARRIPLEQRQILIGRGPTCGILLSDPAVSRLHARLESEADGSWRLVDLGSKNGTRVNESQVLMAPLLDGDVIQIGACCLTLRLATGEQVGPELELAIDATHTIVIDSADMPPDKAVPARTLLNLHKAVGQLGQTEGADSLLRAAVELFRTALEADRVAAGVCSDENCSWPVVVDAEGRTCDGSDLPRRLVNRIPGPTIATRFSWSTILPRGAASDDTPGVVSARCYVFPLKAGKHTLGHIYAERAGPSWDIGEEDLTYLAILCGEIGLLLDRARQQEARELAGKVQRELDAARKVQVGLFPPRLDLEARLDIAARNHPCFGVSGDYYDCRRVRPSCISFILADVMGHGLQAAIMMSRLQVIFDMGVRNAWTLEELDSRLNEAVQTQDDQVVFATGLLGTCDIGTGALLLACAGHPWPSLLVDRRRVRRVESACTLPWGVSERGRNAHPARIRLSDDWSLLAYTDGLAEARDEQDKSYGEDRIASLHAAMQSCGADALCDRAIDDVLEHVGNSRPIQDDMTLIAICSRPSRSGRRSPKRAPSAG